MQVYKTLLVGLDGSDNAARALEKAIELQKALATKLIVFHAVEYHRTPRILPLPLPFNPAYAYTVGDSDYTMIRQQQLDAGKQLVEDAKYMVSDAGIEADIRLVEHQSAEEYALDAIKKDHVDAILIGCKGHSKLERTFIGSVADKLVNEAPCDVIIVR